MSGSIICFECGHTFADEYDLLNEHNNLMFELGLSPEASPDRVCACPMCSHDF